MLIPMISAGYTVADREINFRLREWYDSDYNPTFKVEQFESFKILITSISSPSYPLKLLVSNDDETYSQVKTWTAALDFYEEIIDLVKDYTYFRFNHQTSLGSSTLLVRAIPTSSRDLDFRLRVAGDYTNTAYFTTSDYESFAIKVTSVGHTSYPPKLYGSNGGTTWSVIKSWSAVQTEYEDITNLIKDYEYFYFLTSSASYIGNIDFKVKSTANKLVKPIYIPRDIIEGNIYCYHPTYTGSEQNITANGGTKTITILDENDEPIENAKPFDCWVGIRSITMSGSSFGGWGRLTKEDSGNKVPFSYSGNDFTTSGYNTNLYMVFNENKIVLTNMSTAMTQIYGCYIHYIV